MEITLTQEIEFMFPSQVEKYGIDAVADYYSLIADKFTNESDIAYHIFDKFPVSDDEEENHVADMCSLEEAMHLHTITQNTLVIMKAQYFNKQF